MNAKLFWLRWRGCSIEQTLASMPLPLAYFFGLRIIGYSATTSLFLNLWSHYVLVHSRFAVEWHVCKPISNLFSSIPNTLHKSSWIGPKNWRLYMAYCTTNRRAWICSPQRSISWCNMLTLQMETSFTTITVCLWQEFHSRTCTELSVWWWTPYYTSQPSKKHQSPSNEWCLSQRWIGTNPATHHQREATPQHCQHRGWGTCWHQGTGVLGKW